MQILALGHNHETATIDIRERFAFGPEQLVEALARVRTAPSVRESVILSTCNRNEIYSVVTDINAALSELSRFLTDFHQVEPDLVDHCFHSLEQERAVEHLFSVASGIDSMVVGETQISAQLKSAFDSARQTATTGPILNRLFTAAFEAGKKVRRHTRVSEGSVSVSSCAVELARKIFTPLEDKVVLLVGAGETCRQTARILRDHGVSKFIVANRTVERAAALADRLGGSAVSLDHLADTVSRADIVITSTSSPGHLLTASDVRTLMQGRRNSPLFFIDLSVPRDIDPAVRSMDNVFRYDIDDLSAIAEENRSRRTTEVVKAGEIIRNEVIAFMSWYRSLDAQPTVVSLRRRFEAIGEDEVKRIRRRFPSEMQDDLDSLSRSIVNKLLHHPTIEIKNAASRGDDTYLVHALRQLFHLENPDDDE